MCFDPPERPGRGQSGQDLAATPEALSRTGPEAGHCYDAVAERVRAMPISEQRTVLSLDEGSAWVIRSVSQTDVYLDLERWLPYRDRPGRQPTLTS